ncbi:MAG: hypothetical protein KJ072_16550 [Verrucomicrobia bacterium]|nr:hypothetical protein [Verrucomicrobiota bacterium]
MNPTIGFPPTLPDRRQAEWALTTLKERLIRTMLPMGMDEEQTRFLRLAAGEAEALAWLTPFPHLFLPVLLEEKLSAAKQYVTRQRSARILKHQFSGIAG